jgi:predicted MFS family arabinose efflux permease
MAWYGLLHGLCALAPSFELLLVLRVLAVVTPAIFTPQAAACVGLLAKPEKRTKAITFIFLGWSISSEQSQAGATAIFIVIFVPR